MATTIQWPTILIPAHTSSTILSLFQYSLYLHYGPAEVGTRIPTPLELNEWYGQLGDATQWANLDADKTITHEEAPAPPPTNDNPHTGIGWLDDLLLQLRNVVKPFADAAKGITDAVTALVTDIKNGGNRIMALLQWLDTPQTLERMALGGIGAGVLLIGIITTVASFTGTPSVSDVVKAVA